MRRYDAARSIAESLSALGIGIGPLEADDDQGMVAAIAEGLARAADEKADATFRKRFRISKLTEPVYLRDYLDRPDRGLDMDFLRELHTLDFMERRQNIVLWGSPGTGKSWLAQSIATAACAAGKKVRMVDFQPLMRDLETAGRKSPATFESRLNYYSRFELLVIDEFLNYSLDGCYMVQELFKRIDDMRVCTLVICCQSEPSNWPRLFPARSFGESVRGRILKGARTIQMKGPDIRLL